MKSSGQIKETFSTGFSFDCITYETLKIGLRGRQYKVEITFCINGYSDIDLGQINRFSKDVWRPMFHHSVFLGPHIDYEAPGCGKSIHCDGSVPHIEVIAKTILYPVLDLVTSTKDKWPEQLMNVSVKLTDIEDGTVTVSQNFN